VTYLKVPPGLPNADNCCMRPEWSVREDNAREAGVKDIELRGARLCFASQLLFLLA
jgi:hypothetical protein